MKTSMMNLRHALVFLLPVTLLAVGCSRGSAAPPADASVPEEPTKARRSMEPHLAPDEAALALARGFADGHPEVAWRALPSSYGDEVTVLLHDAAENMDAEVWNRTFGVLRKLTRLLSEKRGFILDHPMLAEQIENREEAEAGWGAVIGVVDVLVNSELSDLDKMKTLDVDAFLATTGSQMMQRLAEASALTPEDPWSEGMAKLRATTATVVSTNEDQAVVRLETPGEPPHEDTYIRVEGKWLPKELVDVWPVKMAEAREKVARLSDEDVQQNKQAVLMQLGMFDSALDSLMAANTAEEFHAGIGAFMGMAMGAMLSQVEQAQAGGGVEITPMIDSHDGTLDTEPGASNAATRPDTSSMKQGNRTPDARPDPIRGPQAVPVDQAHHHVGQTVKIVTRDGREITGTLNAADGATVTVEREISGGTMAVEIDAVDIRSLVLDS